MPTHAVCIPILGFCPKEREAPVPKEMGRKIHELTMLDDEDFIAAL